MSRMRSTWRAGNPRLLRRLVLRSVVKFSLGAEILLVVILLLADLFSNIWRFLAYEVPFGKILLWMLHGLPVHGGEVLSVSLLFAITLTISELYNDGELLVVFGAGVSIRSLTLPVLAFSALLSAGLFLGNDLVSIPSASAREELFRTMTGQNRNEQQIPNITILTQGGEILYNAGVYNPELKILMDIDIVQRDENDKPCLRVVAPSAQWDGKMWQFSGASVFSVQKNGEWTRKKLASYSNPVLNERPDSFEILVANPKYMKRDELKTYIGFLRASGLPSAEAETEYNKRFSFCFTPLIVYGLSIAFSGLFKKNSLLMSLLFSLSAATVYYVAQMIGGIAAKTGWIAPEIGVWSVTLVFLAISITGLFRAKT
ncbi:MAG: LptF/LptG family permease [Spirochaetaceae bacterium]|nr:LptF/LptG family permease [Spirochaetaceae bacterium]